MTALKLDRIDVRILAELQKNSRILNIDLADRVGLSPSPCLMRVRRLLSKGYIKGYRADIDVGRLGQTVIVFTEVTLRNHRPSDFTRFLAAVEKVDAIMECHLISGGYDYLVKFQTAGILEYQRTIERLAEMDVGIDKYFSFVVLKSPIERNYVPLAELFPDPPRSD